MFAEVCAVSMGPNYCSHFPPVRVGKVLSERILEKGFSMFLFKLQRQNARSLNCLQRVSFLYLFPCFS